LGMRKNFRYLGILPPYMLENIIRNGSSVQRQQAYILLEHADLIREKRRNISEWDEGLESNEAFRKYRTVYDALFKTDLPGNLVLSEGEPSMEDLAVSEAYDGAGKTFDLYFDLFGRNSIDNKGMELISTVHYDRNYDNAFWNGEQMIYGDGDQDLPDNEKLFNRFTIAVDVIGHELTHGVTQYTAQLDYYGQPGALNESFSDVFGTLVKQRSLNQEVGDADWIIGQGLFTNNVKGSGIRSLKAPGTAYDDPVLGKDPQPWHMDKYVNTGSDNGGVHINSGIPNHVFYFLATELGGYAWEKAGRIWYDALVNKLKPVSDFQKAAESTYQSAQDLFGEGSIEQNAVKRSWSKVGIILKDEVNEC
jgi:Zn-dependent metalloprotease